MPSHTPEELNALAAEKVMGWEPRFSIEEDSHDRWVRPTGEESPQWEHAYGLDEWDPFHNIAHAMELVKELAERKGWFFSANAPVNPSEVRYTVSFAHYELGKNVHAVAGDLQAAITIAACRALGVDVGEVREDG